MTSRAPVAHHSGPAAPVTPDRAAPLGRRLAARVLDAVLLTGAYVVAVVLELSAGPSLVIALLLLVCAVLLGAVVPLACSATAGQLLLGLRCVTPSDGRRSGPRTLGKYVVQGLSSSLTCGLAPLVALAALQPPLRRSWFDRIGGVVVIDERVVPTALPHPSAPGTPPLGRAVGTPVTTPGPPAPPLAPPPAPSPGSVAGSRDSTRVRGVDPAAVRAETGGAPVPPTRASVRLELDTGQRIEVPDAVVVGRDPRPPAHRPDARPHAVHDTSRSFSKTHFLVVADGGAGRTWITDLHSTNGIDRVLETGGTERLVPGSATEVRAGTELRIGQRTVRVLR